MSLGDVETPCGTMRCTLRALKEVNKNFGSFMGALRRVAEVDTDAITSILASGMGKTVKDVEADAFAHGVRDLIKPVSEYLELLSNGGKPIVQPTEEEPQGGEG